MERNPFEYVRPLPPEAVVGRGELIDRLVRSVINRELVAVIGPRRFGKTSLLGRVAALAADVDSVDAVVVDCFGVASIGDFAVRLERALGELSGPTRTFIQRLFDNSEFDFSLAPGLGFKVALGRKDAPDPTAALHGLLGVLVAASDKRLGMMLVLDEFQDVASVAGLDALLRTHLQHARNLAVLFAGSRPSMLRALFEDRARPFYSQADVVEVPRFSRSTAASIIADGFGRSGRDAGDAAELLAATSDGHPQRLMLLGHLLWDLVDEGATATAEQAGEALEMARQRSAAEHRAFVGSLSATQRDTLRAVVLYGSPYSRAAERHLGLARSSAQSATNALLADAVITRDDPGWSVVDPLLADWIRSHLA